ncbi:MAG: alanine dehydrogenase, partial [Ignavibacteria bacterium]|nr:alanine dehydrogenase [Ignavibacteria bacterium]
MRIGILKETHFEEKRVALTPSGVHTLVDQGHQVFLEKDAGLLSHFTNEEYEKVGAKILYSPDEILLRSELIVKVLPLTEDEASKLHEEQIVISFLQLVMGRKNLLNTFLEKKITSIALELIEDKHGHLPVLNVMSEIAGQLAIQIGARLLENTSEVNRGVLLGGISGVAPAAVVILGAGTVGTNAARAALGLGAQVIVLDNDLEKLQKINDRFGRRLTTVVLSPSTIERGVKFADILIGAVLIKGEKAPHIISEELVKTMKHGAVIIDVSIDQGGCIETSRPTTLSNPTFVLHNVIHYCVPNMPALVSRTASYGLNNAMINYILEIANLGLEHALLSDPGLARGVCSDAGYCTNQSLAELFNVEFKRIQ